MAWRALARVVVVAVLFSVACNRPEEGSPEAVADAFVDAYFRRADQVAAKDFTALGATRMLDKEIEEVSKVRGDGYTPQQASLDVGTERGARSMRGNRVRFDYRLKFKSPSGDAVKHADVELANIDDKWFVVRVGLSDKPAPAASR